MVKSHLFATVSVYFKLGRVSTLLYQYLLQLRDEAGQRPAHISRVFPISHSDFHQEVNRSRDVGWAY